VAAFRGIMSNDLLKEGIRGGAALDTDPDSDPEGPPREAGIYWLRALQKLLTDSILCLVEFGMVVERSEVSSGEVMVIREET
jgi:hypothetical protein